MISFFNLHRKLFLFIFALLFLVVSAFILLSQKPAQLLTNREIQVWNNFQPGKTTKKDVVNKLGDPETETKTDGGSLDAFSSESPVRLHQVLFDSQNVSQLFKKIITAGDTATPKDIIQIYGDASNILYGADSINGIYLYVYSDKGIAYLGNNQSNTLFEIWYFAPTSLDNFMKNLASGYSKEPLNQE